MYKQIEKKGYFKYFLQITYIFEQLRTAAS